MPRVISFVRVSTEEQAEADRAGLLRQREDIRVACARYDLEVVYCIELANVSGAETLAAPEFQAMLNDLSRPDVDGVVVSSQDRLARPDCFEGLAVFDPFMRLKKRIWTPTGVTDLNADAGFVMTGMLALMAGMERKQILHRVQSAKEEQRKRGRCANAKITLPRGIDFDFDSGEWSWVEPEASKIRTAYELLIAGSSLRQIAEQIGGYTDRGLANALRNPIWVGIRRYEYKRGDKYPACNGRQVDRKKIKRTEILDVPIKIVPLISNEVWEKAQGILSSLKLKWNANRSATSRFLIGGISTCICGERMYTKGDRRPGKHDFYFCKSRHPKGKGCGARILRRHEVDSAVERLLTRDLLDEAYVRLLIRQAIPRNSGKKLRNARDREASALRSLESRRSRVIDLATRGLITEADLKGQLERISADAQLFKAQSEQTTNKGENLNRDKIIEWLLATLLELKSLSPEGKRSVVHALISRIELSDCGVTRVQIKLPRLVATARTRTDTGSSRRSA